jgi:PKD domain-containing protein
MKRILTILPLLSLIVIGCKREPFADAVFLSYSPFCAGDYISLESRSTNSDYVEWDMGDGTTYNSLRVDHIYESPGNYEIKLMAFGRSRGVDLASYFVDVSKTNTKKISKKKK